MSREHLKNGNRLYFMNDKNIRDGLVAQKVKAEHLIKLLQDKGIFVARNSSKEDLVEAIQTIRFDYFDYVYLSSLLEHHDKRDNQAKTELPTKFTAQKVAKASDALRKVLGAEEIEAAHVISGKKATIEFSYVDIDYSKAPMRQKTPKKAKIVVDFSNENDTGINFPSTEMGKKVKNLLVKELNSQLPKPVTPIEIDLEHATPKDRNKFFTSLLALDGYEVFDVEKVSVAHASGKDEGESDVTGELRNAALSGKNLLESKVYQGLATTNYNIYRISWKLRELVTIKSSDNTDDNDTASVTSSAEQSDCFTVEAKFDDKERFKGFSFGIKTVQRYNQNKSQLNSTTAKPDKNEIDKLSKHLYSTAVKIYTDLTSEG
ncbi:hypothetical protein [Vibrio campbellii]|uniref:hypothetical protein n=1 Tax=Vibrio campbellii TaxID=680 RepID=UPI0005ED7F01|nr:hypothetical protein [Vibrio campbellii]